MAGAFQANAFQTNAFQMDAVSTGDVLLLYSPMNATLQMTSRLAAADSAVSLKSPMNATVQVGTSKLRE